MNQYPLPEGWRWVELEDVCTKAKKRDPRGSLFESFKYVDISGINNRLKRIVEARSILGKDAPSRARQVIRENDVIVATTRPNLNAVGLISSDFDNEICSTGFSVLRPTEHIYPEYLFFFVQTQDFIDSISGQVRGMLYPAVTDKQVRKANIPLPPLPEQRRIAAKIQELMQDVDRARAACEKQLESARALPAAYLHEVFESKDAKKWEKKKLSEISEEFVNGGTPNTNMPHYWGGNIPWITSADITNLYVSGGRKSITQEGLNDSSTHLVKKNTVLVATRTGVGKVGIASNHLCFSQDITGIICKPNILPEFLVRFLIYQSTNLIMIQRGATIKGLTRKDLESTEVLLPSVQKQQQIVLYLREKINQIDQLLSKMKNQTEKAYALPHKILKQAFRGEL